MEGQEPLLEGLHTVFVIVYLQELAWIFTPLIISLNVLIHSYLQEMDQCTRTMSLAVSLFFLISAACIATGLYLIHSRALTKRRSAFFWPYITFKFVRTVVLLAVATVIFVRPKLRSNYFHISLYAIVESVSNMVAIEICYRSWRFMVRSNRRKRNDPTADDALAARDSLSRLRRSESLQEHRDLIADM